MPGSVRRRAVRAAAAAALAGTGLLLAAGAALADPEAGSQVTFRGNGGVLGLLHCTSEPDRGGLSVRAESMVTFVNHTGQAAVLRVDGRDAGAVDANQALPVVFHRGPVAVSMIPKCGLNLNQTFGSVNVEVTSAAEAGPPRPTGTRAAGGRSPGGTAGRATGAPAGQGAPTAAPDPDGMDLPGPGATLPDGTAGASDVSDIGDPRRAATGNVAVAAPIAAVPGPAGANGLLALVATVCVAGVGAGAFRAILAQRASRSSLLR